MGFGGEALQDTGGSGGNNFLFWMMVIGAIVLSILNDSINPILCYIVFFIIIYLNDTR